MQLDESTLPGNELLLLAYVRFVKRERLVQELLFARQLEADKKRGGTVFCVVKNYFKEKYLPLTNILACRTDVGNAASGMFTVHCII